MRNLLESNPRVPTEKAGGDNAAVLHEVERKERLASVEAFPHCKQADEERSEDDHADYHGRSEAMLLVCCERK